MVGGAASFTVKDRLKLLADLEPLRKATTWSTVNQPVELRRRQALDPGAAGEGV